MGQEASSTAPHPPAITIPNVPPQTYFHHTTLLPRPKIILIGDSITELGSHSQGWVASLAIRYNRRADVVNRGMNGYTSRWGLAAIPLILEEMLGPQAQVVAASSSNNDCAGGDTNAKNDVEHSDSIISNDECLQDKQTSTSEKEHHETKSSHPQYTFIIGYGANDSCLPDGGAPLHHVPLKEYSSNLKHMIQMIKTWNTKKNVAVALLTPPPCDTEIHQGTRDNENVTKSYAEACIQVANDMSVPVVDLWRGMQLPISKNGGEDEETSSSSFKKSEQWKIDYLSDGLHLTPMGNYRLYELVVELLDGSSSDVDEEVGLGLAVQKLPRSYPDHTMIDSKDPYKTFGTGEYKLDKKVCSPASNA